MAINLKNLHDALVAGATIEVAQLPFMFEVVPDPTERDYLVDFSGQIVVKADGRVEARVIVADALKTFIERSSGYPNDPMNGTVVDGIEDVTSDTPGEPRDDD